MSKNKYLKQEETPEVNASTENDVPVAYSIPEAKDMAIGYSKTKEGKWVITRVDFDLETGYTKTPTVIETVDNEAEAVDRFKINVAQTLMLRGRN